MTKVHLFHKKKQENKKKTVFGLSIIKKFLPLHSLLENESNMVDVVQLVRASDCGSECRGFESHPPPGKPLAAHPARAFFIPQASNIVFPNICIYANSKPKP